MIEFSIDNDENGYFDIDVNNAGSIRRVKVVKGIRKGDNINVYYGESSKEGGAWLGKNEFKGTEQCFRDLERSLKATHAYKSSALKNSTSLKIPKKYFERIVEVTRENCDDSRPKAYVIYLHDEWCCGEDHGVGTLIEYTQKDALERLRNTIKWEGGC